MDAAGECEGSDRGAGCAGRSARKAEGRVGRRPGSSLSRRERAGVRASVGWISCLECSCSGSGRPNESAIEAHVCRPSIDPGSVNGGPLLGLNGVVVKSHGGADAKGFANAIKVAADLAASDYAEHIAANTRRLSAALQAGKDPAEKAS